MIRRPPRSTRTANPFTYTPRVRSVAVWGDTDGGGRLGGACVRGVGGDAVGVHAALDAALGRDVPAREGQAGASVARGDLRSEEHTSELQSLMRISYAVFCLKKKKTEQQDNIQLNKTQICKDD